MFAVDTGDALEANSIPVAKEDADEAFLSSACIGCGACVAACKKFISHAVHSS